MDAWLSEDLSSQCSDSFGQVRQQIVIKMENRLLLTFLKFNSDCILFTNSLTKLARTW